MRLLGGDWVSFKVVVLGPTFAIIMLPIGIIGAAFDAVFWNIYAVRSRPLWRFRPEISTVRAWCRRVRSSRNAIRDSLLPPRIDPPSWVLQNIPIHTRPVHQPQRVGLEVPSRRRVVVAHPVLVEAGFALEPRAGEAGGGGCWGGGVDGAEGGEGDKKTVQWTRRRGNAALRPFLILLHPPERPSTPARAGVASPVRCWRGYHQACPWPSVHGQPGGPVLCTAAESVRGDRRFLHCISNGLRPPRKRLTKAGNL